MPTHYDPQTNQHNQANQTNHTTKTQPTNQPTKHNQVCFPVLAAYAKSIKDDADYILREVTSLLIDERYGYENRTPTPTHTPTPSPLLRAHHSVRTPTHTTHTTHQPTNKTFSRLWPPATPTIHTHTHTPKPHLPTQTAATPGWPRR
jgi:hypothetical protein